jgi:hypothetical protein
MQNHLTSDSNMSVKEKAIRIVPQVKSTNIVFTTAILIIAAAFAMISTPQMIGVANAQSDRASERACPVPGYTLERGECTADPITRPSTCPRTVEGLIVRPIPPTAPTACIVGGPESVVTSEFCDALGGVRNVIPSLGQAVCRFPVTNEISCPGGVPPTEEGECITRPGQGNDPTD